MFTHFTPAEQAVHHPADRRRYIGLAPGTWLALGLLLLGTVGAAWVQFLVFGLPPDPSAHLPPLTPADPRGFPWWVSVSHWVSFFFLMLLIRSGLSILADHPRLYWNRDSTPGTEWARFTPTRVPDSPTYTSKEDARYLSPLWGLPGYRHTVGVARSWHFLTVPFFVLNGAVFVVLLFCTNQWRRLVPTSWHILPDAWRVFVHYATFHFPIEPDGFYRYNAIQQLSYFGVIFILAPLAMLTGVAMSPAIENRFHWFPRLLGFGSRQGARSVHFLVMLAFVGFILIHVTLVALTGLTRNLNHLTTGTDTRNPAGLYIGLAIVLATVAACVAAQWASWNRPRTLQRADAALNGRLWYYTLNRLQARPYYHKKDISPYFWVNGKIPTSDAWKQLLATNFQDYKLTVKGLVEHPVELSLADLRRLGHEQTITMHHCIQGWTGIAAWGGLPMQRLIELVRPQAAAHTVVFYSYGEGLYGGQYYDTLSLASCRHPGCLLAWEMNEQALPPAHGAPLRLRIEDQLGYKMVKWIHTIEFVETYQTIGKGYGGRSEDDEYFDLLAST